jgi:hypothetical protein
MTNTNKFLHRLLRPVNMAGLQNNPVEFAIPATIGDTLVLQLPDSSSLNLLLLYNIQAR